MNNEEARDREAISALLIDYCFALDRREFSRLASDVFTPDASFGGAASAPGCARGVQGTRNQYMSPELLSRSAAPLDELRIAP